MTEPSREEQRPQDDLSLPIVLLFNLAIIGALALLVIVINGGVIKLDFIGGPILPPCVSPVAGALSFSVILLMSFHLVWRYFHSPIERLRDQRLFGRLEVLVVVLNELHPWELSDLALWALAIVLIAAGILSLSPVSPFRPLEGTVIIESFSIRYQDQTESSKKPGDVLQITTGDLVRVAVVDQVNTLCTWFAVNGTLSPTRGCSAVYSLPFGEEWDSLVVLIQSPCKTQQGYASLHIKVVQVPP